MTTEEITGVGALATTLVAGIIHLYSKVIRLETKAESHDKEIEAMNKLIHLHKCDTERVNERLAVKIDEMSRMFQEKMIDMSETLHEILGWINNQRSQKNEHNIPKH